MTRWARKAFGLPKSKWNSISSISPSLPVWPEVQLVGPGVARLQVQLPIGLGDGGGVHQLVGLEAVLAAFAPPLAHPSGVHAGVDHQVGDVDALRAELARHALRHGPEAELGAGEGGEAGAAAQAGGGAG